jgi:hypothetical protein
MARQAISIKQKTDTFEAVSFVEGKTDYQLKVIIKNLFLNMQELATATQDVHPDVAMILDRIMDGHSWKETELTPTTHYSIIEGLVLCFNSSKKQFQVLGKTKEDPSTSYKGMNLKEFLRFIRS